MDICDFSKIYDWLEDDNSKKCYEAVSLYNLTKKFIYLGNYINQYCERKPEYKKPYLGDIIERNKNNQKDKIILWGACSFTNYIIDALSEYGITVECICDKNKKKEGMIFRNVPVVYPFDYFKDHDPKEYIYIICIIDGHVKKDADNMIAELGVENTRRTYGVCYYGHQYFDNDIVKLSDEEVFIDCGSLDLMTCVDFSHMVNGKYKKIFSFEADVLSYEKCNENLKKYGLHDCEIIPKGVYDCSTKLRFSGGGGGGSQINENGKMVIDTVSIDEILQGESASFIKMDIEGAELKALIGAKETIRKYRPKLAISIYHKPEDLLEIPVYIKELVPDYTLYMRHYSSVKFETILYAI